MENHSNGQLQRPMGQASRRTFTEFLKLRSGQSINTFRYLYRLRRAVPERCDILLDEHGNVLTWCKDMQALKGYHEDEVLGQHLSLFFMPRDRQAGVPERLLAAAALQGHAVLKGDLVCRDGNPYRGRMRVKALKRRSTLLGYLVSFEKCAVPDQDDAPGIAFASHASS